MLSATLFARTARYEGGAARATAPGGATGAPPPPPGGGDSTDGSEHGPCVSDHGSSLQGGMALPRAATVNRVRRRRRPDDCHLRGYATSLADTNLGNERCLSVFPPAIYRWGI